MPLLQYSFDHIHLTNGCGYQNYDSVIFTQKIISIAKKKFHSSFFNIAILIYLSNPAIFQSYKTASIGISFFSQVLHRKLGLKSHIAMIIKNRVGRLVNFDRIFSR